MVFMDGFREPGPRPPFPWRPLFITLAAVSALIFSIGSFADPEGIDDALGEGSSEFGRVVTLILAGTAVGVTPFLLLLASAYRDQK